jgi:beta-mannosidase
MHNIITKITGDWTFSELGKNEFMPAKIPGCVHTDLMTNNIIGDPFYRSNESELQWIDKKDWEYSLKFDVDEEICLKKNISLDFKGLDTFAEVFLNGVLVCRSDNMFREWKVSCREHLKRSDNILRIIFSSPVTAGLERLESLGFQPPAANDLSETGGLGGKKVSPFIRKAPYHFGWDWGPRLVTSGVWRPVFIEAWDDVKIEDVCYRVGSLDSGKAVIDTTIEILSTDAAEVTLKITDVKNKTELLSICKNLDRGTNLIECGFVINNPKLWWTNGLGQPDLYEFKVEVISGGHCADERTTEYGIRTVKVVTEKDSNGAGFYFELNGIPVFMKGANYIPCDIFPSRVTTETYEKVIGAAVDANMNMLRVWGGGIYEDDRFYEICDRNGILIWQDFMFACSMYPLDAEFESNIFAEIEENIKRLRNHASIAIWCGNNEIQSAWAEGREDGGWGWKQRFNGEQRKFLWNSYMKLFYELIPGIVQDLDPQRFYWPSSPVGAYDWYDGKTALESGDLHYWGVWHKIEPFERFRDNIGRFMSEYGFQSFPEYKTVSSFTLPEDLDIESPVMRSHQKSGTGNTLIREYMKIYYPEPVDFKATLYASLVMQAEGIKSAIEAHRTRMPFCMGSLYWQINDCWPVASWSSMDYFLRWKALHYFARKAFGRYLAVPYVENGRIMVYAVSDDLAETKAVLKISLTDLNGKIFFVKNIDFLMKAGTSSRIFDADKNEVIGDCPANESVFYTELSIDGVTVSDNALYFENVKNLKLRKPELKTGIKKDTDRYIISLQSLNLVKNVYLSLEDEDGFFSDNYFDMMPGQTKTVVYIPSGYDSRITEKLNVTTLYEAFYKK